jgi:hypothetical protein
MAAVRDSLLKQRALDKGVTEALFKRREVHRLS